MIPELGQFTLILALASALVLSIYPLLGAARSNTAMMLLARPLAYAQFGFLLISFLCLTWAFIEHDFTVLYVASNSNSLLPLAYRISAVWGAHEGSLLLWVLILAGWTAAVARFSRALPLDAVARVLSVMGMIAIGFLLFVLLTSNPFERTLPFFPVDGRDLNPLLQDPGLIFHPPMLYMGYVGFSVAFAFAIASLMTGKLDAAWARWSRPWTMAAWIFLTLGIALGSWWAYYELGWGGWWFWDPVENASFMPWLAGTALIHSLAVTEKRASFKAWTVLLAIMAFSLSLLGTFLVRSGVLVSVHAFASDPTRGLFILIFLLLVVGSSLLLYAIKGAEVRSHGKHELASRESLLLGNNIILMAGLVVVLIGTLLPLVHKELGMGSISIGAPFFNSLYAWLIIPFALLLGAGPLFRWRRQQMKEINGKLLLALVLSIAIGVALPVLFSAQFEPWAALGIGLGAFITITSLQETWVRATHRHAFFTGVRKLGNSHWAMILGHIGLAVTIIGISCTQLYSIERDVRMLPGDTVTFADYTFTFEGIREADGPNYDGFKGVISVAKNGQPLTELKAEKRFYLVQRMSMTEAAIDAGFTRDLYAALGEELDDGAWAVRLYYKPFVRWIWFGGLLMSIGGVIAMMDKRYRFGRKQQTVEAQ
ncbi:heme lyase CcmF/NrfE family subunit [Oceanimonas baumannii]|uniref:Cytochrome c-type biogenesis protein CcmF n=1 Tax=Oceanimonas baumannii TaxID=129578 RepID=A0A235CN27_9GAMM|nr:heme lyase CcmF/NrfE family subunit [Oceanimonas baumannii]MCC4263149.1 heme lyase CcmF/NrfE family subunit [Oceanimonas baumannii]OYD25940.1 heme lyase NrfEFG subunit NrfE [Oceanimonas baumannii]TDW60042.1 cytochrome c-type biogenesis protein CcmF [Oceanimonas baumannii]